MGEKHGNNYHFLFTKATTHFSVKVILFIRKQNSFCRYWITSKFTLINQSKNNNNGKALNRTPISCKTIH